MTAKNLEEQAMVRALKVVQDHPEADETEPVPEEAAIVEALTPISEAEDEVEVAVAISEADAGGLLDDLLIALLEMPQPISDAVTARLPDQLFDRLLTWIDSRC